MRRKGKRRQRMILYASFFLVFLMLLSTVGFFFRGDMGSNRYRGYAFTRPERSNLWYTVIDGSNMAFYYFPADIEHLMLDREIVDLVKGSAMVYITYNPEGIYRENIALISLEMSEILWDKLKVYAETGFTKETEFTEKVITCDNAMPNLPVIYFMESNSTSISMENSCIMIEGRNNADFVMLYERLIYGLLGVIE